MKHQIIGELSLPCPVPWIGNLMHSWYASSVTPLEIFSFKNDVLKGVGMHKHNLPVDAKAAGSEVCKWHKNAIEMLVQSLSNLICMGILSAVNGQDGVL